MEEIVKLDRRRTYNFSEFLGNEQFQEKKSLLLNSLSKYEGGAQGFGFSDLEIVEELFHESLLGKLYRVKGTSSEESIVFVTEFSQFLNREKEKIILQQLENEEIMTNLIFPKCQAQKVTPIAILSQRKYIDFVKNTFDVRTLSYIQMKTLPTKHSLSEYMKNLRNQNSFLTEAQIFFILSKICQFIEICHQNKLAGFNLQPENIYFSSDQPLLLDISTLKSFSTRNEISDFNYADERKGLSHLGDNCTLRQLDYYSVGMIGLAIACRESKFAHFSSGIKERFNDYQSQFPNLFPILEKLMHDVPSERANLQSILGEKRFQLKVGKIFLTQNVEPHFNNLSIKSDLFKEALANVRLGKFDWIDGNSLNLNETIEKEFKSETSLISLLDIIERCLMAGRNRQFAVNCVEKLLSLINEKNQQIKFKVPLILMQALYHYSCNNFSETSLSLSKIDNLRDVDSNCFDSLYLVIHHLAKAKIACELGNLDDMRNSFYNAANYYNNLSHECSYDFEIYKYMLEIKGNGTLDMIGYLMSYIGYYKDLYGKTNPEVLVDYSIAANYLIEFGNILEGFSLLENVVVKAQAVFGKDHKIMVDLLSKLSHAYYVLRNKRKARDVAHEAYKLFLKHFGKEHPNIVGMLNNLAVYCSDNGEREKAISYLEVAISIKYESAKSQTELAKLFTPKLVTKDLGFDLTLGHDAELLFMLNNLSLIYYEEGQDKNSEEILVRAFKIGYEAKKFKGYSDSSLDNAYGVIVHNIAVFYEDKGNYERALYFLNTCVDIFKASKKDFSPITIKVNINKANIFENQGESEKALELLNETYDKAKKFLTENCEEMAMIHNNFGTIYSNQGLKEKALEHFEKCISIRLKIFPSNAPILGFSYNNLAIVQSKLGKINEANESLSKAVEILSNSKFRVDKKFKSVVSNNLGVNLLAKESYEEAMKVFFDVLTTREEIYPAFHPEIGVVWNNIAMIYYKQGNIDKAEDCFKKSIEHKRSMLKEGSPSMNSSFYNYSILLQNKKQPDKVVKLCEDRISRAKTEYDPGSVELAFFFYAICELYQLIGEREKAREFCEKSNKIYLEKFGENDPRVLAGLEKLKELKFT